MTAMSACQQGACCAEPIYPNTGTRGLEPDMPTHSDFDPRPLPTKGNIKAPPVAENIFKDIIRKELLKLMSK